MRMPSVISFLSIVFILVISFPVILPYFHPGYFPTHDGEWAVVRLSDMFRELRDHQFPARFSGNLNFGYGYPLFNFAYPFPYYLGTLFHFVKLGFVDSIKLLFAISVPLSAFCMFLVSKELWKNYWAAIVSAILYVYFPYRFIDLYVRGSIGESLSFIFFPLIVFLLLKIRQNPISIRFIIFTSFFYAMLITTHNIMAVLFTLLISIYCIGLIFIKEKKALISSIIAFIGGFFLSSFFWIPAITEKHIIALSQTPIADRNLYFVNLTQLVLPKWGYGIPTDLNGFSYQIGLPHLAIFITVVSVLLLAFLKKKMNLKETSYKIITVLIVMITIFFVLLFPFSSVVWRLPFLSEINYPWTILAILGFLLSMLAGFLSIQKNLRYLLILFGIFSVILFLPYAKPQYYVNRGDFYYITNDATTTSSDELMPLWVTKKPFERQVNKVVFLNGTGEISHVVSSSNHLTFDTLLKTNSVLRINTIYYPGWEVVVDKKRVPVSYSNIYGVMDVVISEGPHVVVAHFKETPLRLFADYLSLLFFVISIALLVYAKINNTSQKVLGKVYNRYLS